MKRILKRPGIRFIASLPTVMVNETTYKNTVIWKVEPPRPVDILYSNHPVVNHFWVEIITESRWDKGWHYIMSIGIKSKKSARSYIIPPQDEGFYTKTKWWKWHTDKD